MKHSGRILLALALVGGLSACAKPQGAIDSSKEEASSNQGGLILGPVPAGYTDLGSTVAGKPGEGYFIGGPASAASTADLALGVAHSKAVFDARKTPYVVQVSDCVGAGATPDKAIAVSNLGNPMDEVRADIACAQLQHPDAQWFAARLIVNNRGDRYLSVIALLDRHMQHIEVYAEASRFAAKAAQAAL